VAVGQLKQEKAKSTQRPLGMEQSDHKRASAEVLGVLQLILLAFYAIAVSARRVRLHMFD